MPMEDKLKKLRDALLDRGLSLLPPRGTPVSSEVTEEAVLIYEALAATPLPEPPKTGGWTVRTYEVKTPRLDVAAVRRMLGIPEPTKSDAPALASAEFLRELHDVPNRLYVALSDGTVASFEVRDTSKTLDAVARWIENNKSAFPGPAPLFGWLDGINFGAVRYGDITFFLNGERMSVAVSRGDTASMTATNARSLLQGMLAAAKPVLGVQGDKLVVLGAGSMCVSTDDGRYRKIEVQEGHTFAAVVKAAKTAVMEIAESIVPMDRRLLGHRDGYGYVALRDGSITIKVGPAEGSLSVGDGENIGGSILSRVGGLLSDLADPRTDIAKRTVDAPSTPPPVMHFPRASTSAWAGRDPGDRWVAGNVLGRLSPDVPAVLNRGRITIETTDGHLALVDVEPRHTFDEVVRCVKLGLRLEIDRLTSTGKDTLFARMASSGDTCVLRRGKVTLRTSGAVETGFYVEPLESLSTVEDRITAKLAALAGIHTPLFGCETVTGRFLTLRDGVLQVGDPLDSTEAIPVAKGASLERVLDQVKEALLKRAGAAVGNPKPASSAHLGKVGSNAVEPEGGSVGSASAPEVPILGIVDGRAAVLRDGVIWLEKWHGGKSVTVSLPASKEQGFDVFAALAQRLFGRTHENRISDRSGEGVTLTDGTQTVGITFEKTDPEAKLTLLRDLAVLLAARSDPDRTLLPDHRGLAALIHAACGPLAPSRFDEVKVTFMAPDVEHGATFTAAQVRAILAGGDPWASDVSRDPNRFYLYLGSEARVAQKTRLVPDAPLPKGHAEVVTGGTYRPGQGIPCRWVGDGAVAPNVVRWVFQNPPQGACYAYLAPEPPADAIPACSIGIVYPKIADTAAHDTAAFRAGAILKPAVYPSPQDAVPATISLLTSSVLRTGGALVCKTVDGSPWPSNVARWRFMAPVPGVDAIATSAPSKPIPSP